MKKQEIRGIAVLAILPAAFTVIAFALPLVKNAAFWLAYVFAVIAVLVQGYALYAGFVKGDQARSKLYGFPIARIGSVYMTAQLIASLVFMALAKWMPLWLELILCAVALAAFCDALQYSDPVGSDAIADIESALTALVDDLQKALTDGDLPGAQALCRKAQATLTERNRLCRLNKG